MTRRPQNITYYDEVFAAYETSTAIWIVGGMVRGIKPGVEGGILISIHTTKLYSVTYKEHLNLKPNGVIDSDLTRVIEVPKANVRHINDVRFLK